MKLARERRRPDRTQLGVPQEPLGIDAVFYLVPLRSLRIGGGVRHRGRGCATRPQDAALRMAAAVVAFSRIFTGRPLPQ